MRSRVTAFRLIVTGIAFAGLAFLLAPLVMVVINSIGPEALAIFPPERITFEAYFNIPGKWIASFRNSVLLALAASAIACLLGTLAALALARGGIRSRQLVDGLLRSPLQAPALVLGIAFLQYYSWLSFKADIELRATFTGLLIAHSAVATPYVLTVVLARLVSFDRNLEDAAFGLGASVPETFFRVTLPAISPAILSGGFFAFLLSLDNVPLSLFLVGGPMSLLPVELFNAIQFDLTRPVYAVATLVCLVTTILVIALYRRLTAVVDVARM